MGCGPSAELSPPPPSAVLHLLRGMEFRLPPPRARTLRPPMVVATAIDTADRLPPPPTHRTWSHSSTTQQASWHLPLLAGGPNQSRKSRASYGEEGNVSNRRHDVARAARGRQTSVEAVGTGQACSVRGARTRTRAAARWQKKPRAHARTPAAEGGVSSRLVLLHLRRSRFSRRRRSVISGTGRGA